jgi:DnaJ homolog subfamily C member 2
LTDPVRRRQFDSVDEAADVEPPSKKEAAKPGAFFKKWSPFFKSEARFSNRAPVPMLGDEKSSKEDVTEFYDFWYEFDSWRSFEYLDEDVPDDNADRDHKRHIEKKNKNQRAKRKTEDIKRLRQCVDECLSNDPRMKIFRQEEAKNKNKKKFEKEAAQKAEAEAKAKAKAEEEARKKEEEEKAKADKDKAKKDKEAAKNAVKKNKRVVKGSVKDVNYFAEGSASPQQVDAVLDDVDTVLAAVDPDGLAKLVEELKIAGTDGAKVKEVFINTAKAAGKEGGMKVFK